nr:60S ribosomal protein L10-like [Rattus norvegicus]
MRGAFGKPQGTVARVHIGQVIMSIRTKLQNKEHVIEALRRAKFKFPGCQKIHISKKWGFTKFNADEFEDMVAEKRLIPDGCGVKYIPNRGPPDKWRALHSRRLPQCSPIPYQIMFNNKSHIKSEKKSHHSSKIMLLM